MAEQNKPAQSNPAKSVTTPPMPVKHTREWWKSKNVHKKWCEEMSDEKKIVIKAEQEKDTAQENTNPALLMKTPAMPLKMEFAEKITKEPEVKIKKANS